MSPFTIQELKILAGEAKGKTFEAAKKEILDYLATSGWKVVSGLKIPHATSPSGKFRLWFKAQAVYFTEGQHEMKYAHTLSYDQDIRKMDGPSFLSWVGKHWSI